MSEGELSGGRAERRIGSDEAVRRMDCVLEPTRAAVLEEFEAKTAAKLNPEPFLIRKAKENFRSGWEIP